THAHTRSSARAQRWLDGAEGDSLRPHLHAPDLRLPVRGARRDGLDGEVLFHRRDPAERRSAAVFPAPRAAARALARSRLALLADERGVVTEHGPEPGTDHAGA